MNLYTNTNNSVYINAIKQSLLYLERNDVTVNTGTTTQNSYETNRELLVHSTEKYVDEMQKQFPVGTLCLAIEEGIILRPRESQCCLIAVISLAQVKFSGPLTTISSELPIPAIFKKLFEENKEASEIFETVFGKQLSVKDVYTEITGKDKTAWLQEPLTNALRPFLKNKKFYQYF